MKHAKCPQCGQMVNLIKTDDENFKFDNHQRWIPYSESDEGNTHMRNITHKKCEGSDKNLNDFSYKIEIVEIVPRDSDHSHIGRH